MTEDSRPYGFVKIYRPNKLTKKLEYVKSVDPYKDGFIIVPTVRPTLIYLVYALFRNIPFFT